MEAIAVENLTKQYHNGVQALNGLSLTVGEGEIFSLLGQNGSGKSTLINILTTYLLPTSGKAVLFGKDVSTEASAIRPQIACVAQRTSIDPYLSLQENMLFQSRLHKIPKAEAEARMKILIAAFGLERYLNYPVNSYSGGVRRRLDIALNMMSNPKILFLDEPTVGMDLQSRQAMHTMMKKIRRDFGTTIFLTTHYLEEADSLSDRICIIRGGKEAAQGSPKDLRRYLKQNFLKVSFEDQASANDARTCLPELFSTDTVRWEGNAAQFPIADRQKALSQTAEALLDRKLRFTGIEIVEPSIEEVFLHLTCERGEVI
ncbi:ATP-binding cassette domain-containing protein [Emergencia timonensis]|uniref:ABC transporter ATP-binding protein n=1 Tax=Emergencia timonensis TaxID=1776384 RepID=UPI00399671DC